MGLLESVVIERGNAAAPAALSVSVLVEASAPSLQIAQARSGQFLTTSAGPLASMPLIVAAMPAGISSTS